ncbi:capsular biosynthesis protein [Gluconacetobacter entanii]|uniref:Capsular biosynthesis protein n=1 Tax=Gluconacetobacter entanii TaxID=108528 RepID=A0ABT3K4S4_9PROT|nr:capsular biosynthesis protein [Gluconacetobacter entanii]MBE7620699.1 capsular biosynthesis protein [Komagataeibacter sp. FXV2]MCE2579329.1 capsular biosynthesis protein [Komagataeibacter sp. FNDCR1]MBY4638977.1 capsular biosynthesis protein [Gluconacetobacter entanii]MCW4579123.1 capsular biosynthesis protein [Gluconacetobacter entanii]MCW4582362.1 capsular biosynthesis protein [Gluconacetobacter entanii]
MNNVSERSVVGERRFLFLQGLMGPFFRELGKAFRRAGYGVYKINFNGGDYLFWGLPNGIDFTGDMEEWPAFFNNVIKKYRITDVLLFGDCRPLHRIAIAACSQMHIPVHVFEEGYIRPDWVTLELGGVNGHSALPRDPEWFRKEAAMLSPMPPHYPVPSSFRRRALEAVAYNSADLLSRWHYRHWCDYRPWHPLKEGVGWVKRLRRRKVATEEATQIMQGIETRHIPYMLFPLQLDADAQVRLHSPFAGMEPALRKVIGSFAANAPQDLVLVIKEHPLDNGVRDWRALVAQIAREEKVQGRVLFLEAGDIALIVRAARGVITINSTTGTLALSSGVPVITLGEAVYDIPDITDQNGLDNFWTHPTPPDKATFDAFYRVLVDRCLIAGGFFSPEGLSSLVDGVVRRVSRVLPANNRMARVPDTITAAPAVSEVVRVSRDVVLSDGVN